MRIDNKEAIIFTQHRYASETILNTVKLAIPAKFANTVDSLARNLTFGSIPHEGARIIASELAQAGYAVEMRNLFDDKAVKKARQAGLVLISSMDIGLDQTSKLIDMLGPRDNLMLGGVGINPVAQELSARFPWATIISDEAENLIGQALDDYGTKRYMEKKYRRKSRFNLSELNRHPASDERFSCRELPMFQNSPLKVTEASRGCPEGCEFCPTARQPVTVKPLTLLNREIEQMKFGAGNVLFFVDQNLMACPPPYLHELFDLLNKKILNGSGKELSRTLWMTNYYFEKWLRIA